MKKISKRLNKNTELCIDVTTYLQSDRRMKAGKSYQGMLRRDVEADEYRYNETMTFVETCSEKRVKRNPHIFEGKHITVTQRDNGTSELPRRAYRRARIQRGTIRYRRGQRTAMGIGGPDRRSDGLRIKVEKRPTLV